MKNFDKLYQQIMENMTTGSVLGPSQVHSAVPGQSGDFYAPGDARNIFGSITKRKKKKTKKESVKVIRRTFPGM